MKRITRDDTEHGVEYYRADEVDSLLAEQPAQQEFVATLWQHSETGRTRITMPGDITDCDARWFKAADLYTSPAQRTWVGLTDEHRAMIQRGVDRTTPPFNPDWKTEAVLVEEMQRMAKRIEKLEATLERQTTRIVDLQTHIANLEGEE